MTSNSQQAGDRYVDFVVTEIQKAGDSLPGIIDAAEFAADLIVQKDGRLLAAGDDAFGMEQIRRSAGFAFTKRYKPEKAGSSARFETSDEGLSVHQSAEFEKRFFVRDAEQNDVALLGYENEREEEAHLTEMIKQLHARKAFIVLFASKRAAGWVRSELGDVSNLVSITHDVPDGGVIEIPGWPEKVCSARGLINRLYLWLFGAELIAAFLRRGKIPGILLSSTYESPQIWNLPLIDSYKFIPAFNVSPVRKGVFGQAYLKHLRDIAVSVVPDQRNNFRVAAQWLADAVRSRRTVRALTMGSLSPVGLAGNPDFFVNYTDPFTYDQDVKKIQSDEVALYAGYNWYPTALAEALDRASAKLILSITCVQDFPPTPLDLGEPFIQVSTLDDLPKHKNHVYIDSKFDQYDGCMTIPGYPIPGLPTSFLSVPLVYWHLVADTVELLAKK